MTKKLLKVALSLISAFLLFFSTNTNVSAFTLASVASDPDVNVRLRGFGDAIPTLGSKNLIDVGGPTDSEAPQLSTMMGSGTNLAPAISNIKQVKDYNGGAVIPADNSNNWGVTLMNWASPGDPVKVPASGYDIGGGYQVVVLYASSTDITISYTTGESGITKGYTVHVLGFVVDPDLKSKVDAAKSVNKVVALPCGYNLGTATANQLVSIRDTGSFMDPRTRKDWWNNPPASCQNLPAKEILIGEAPGESSQSLTVSGNPIPQPYVSGGDTRDNEFHALRPYQASPFGMIERYVEQDTLFCGNDIIVKQTAQLEPNGNCIQEGNNLKCSGYVVSGSARVEVDLKESDLPIINNTTLVPNRINKANTIDDSVRVNNYVNWFLSGTAFSAYDKQITSAADQIEKLINFSGPLNKLLPASVLDFNRGQTADQTQYRHNQIYECLLLGNPVSCVGTLTGVSLQARLKPEGDNKVGASDPLKRSPYMPLAPTEDRAGEVVVPEPQVLNDATKPTQPKSPDNITVDKNTLVFEPDPGIVNLGILQSLGVGTPNQNNPSVINNAPTPARNDLYFSGVEEASDLAELLQKTYVPISLPSFSGDTGQDAPYFNTTSFTKRCELADAKTNRGDDLFGDFHSDQKGYYTNIKGKVSYTTEPFDVVFTPEEQKDPACVTACAGNQACIDNVCQTITTYSKKVSIYAAMSVYTKSPQLNEIAERLVSGAAGVVQKFFPEEILTNVIEKKDYAAYTNADYKLAADNTSPNVEVLAGDPKNNRSGKDARIYFPHLGSVEEYFLKGIQCALRPQGMCDNYQLAAASEKASNQNACTIDGSGFKSKIIQAIIANASKWSHVPIPILVIILRNEAGCDTNPNDPNRICAITDEEVTNKRYVENNVEFPTNCNAASDSSRGPVQFRTDEWGIWGNAVNTALGENRTPNVCNIKDSIYALALEMSATYPPANSCPRSSYQQIDQSIPTTWSLAKMQGAVSRFAVGCQYPACADPRYTADDYYCSRIEAVSQSVANECK